MPTCPDGHVSAAKDYCDVCGSPIGMPARRAAETRTKTTATTIEHGRRYGASSVEQRSGRPATPGLSMIAPPRGMH